MKKVILIVTLMLSSLFHVSGQRRISQQAPTISVNTGNGTIVNGVQVNTQNFIRQSVNKHVYHLSNPKQIQEQQLLLRKLLIALDGKTELTIAVSRQIDSLSNILSIYGITESQVETSSIDTKRLQSVKLLIDQGLRDSADAVIIREEKEMEHKLAVLLSERRRKENELSKIDEELKTIAVNYEMLGRYSKTNYEDSLALHYAKKSVMAYRNEQNLLLLASLLSDELEKLKIYYLLVSQYALSNDKLVKVISSLTGLPQTAGMQDKIAGRPERKYEEPTKLITDTLGFTRVCAEAFCEIGHVYAIKGDLDSAIIYYQHSKLAFESLMRKSGKEYEPGLESVLYSLGHSYARQNKFAEAINTLHSAAYMYMEQGKDTMAALYFTIYANILMETGDMYADLKKWPEAISDYDDACSIFRIGIAVDGGDYYRKVSIALRKSAHARYARDGDILTDSTLMLQKEAVLLLDQMTDKKSEQYILEKATALNNLSLMFKDIQNFDSAFLCIREAYSLLSRSGDTATYWREVCLTSVLGNMLNIMTASEQLQQQDVTPIVLYNELISLLVNINIKYTDERILFDLATAYNNYGILLANNNEKEKGLENFRQAEDLLDKLNLAADHKLRTVVQSNKSALTDKQAANEHTYVSYISYNMLLHYNDDHTEW